MRSSLLAVGVSATLLVQSFALGQTRAPSSDSKTVAEVLFYTARGMLEAGKLSQACDKFAESYRLDPTPGTLLNLAVCHEKEGKLGTAWGEFREAIADAQKANRPDREELAREHVAVIEPDLPRLTVEVPVAARVPGARVFRNGTELTEGAWDTPLPADPGAVTLELKAPGYYPVKQEVFLAKRQQLSVALEVPRREPVVVPPQPFFTPRRTLGVVLGGAGVAALVTGAAFGAAALDQKHKSDASCPLFDGERRCTSTGVAAMEQANTLGWVSTTAMVGGALALGAGIYFAVTKDGDHEASATRIRAGSVAWTYSVGPTPGGAGAVLSGVF